MLLPSKVIKRNSDRKRVLGSRFSSSSSCSSLKTCTQPTCCLQIKCVIRLPTSIDERADPILIEQTATDIATLKEALDTTIKRRRRAVRLLLSQQGSRLSALLLSHRQRVLQNTATRSTCSLPPLILDIQSRLKLVSAVSAEPISPIDTAHFSISSSTGSPFTLSILEAKSLFRLYGDACNPLLPIFPQSFFQSTDLVQFLQSHQLLFWSIMLVGLLHSDSAGAAQKYLHLCSQVQLLVVQECWLSTPRSVYILLALLVLTTWPIPNHQTRIAENYSIKLLALAKSLCAQFGLHRLEFIKEFSHKTIMADESISNLSHVIRQRIFKLTIINSNTWLVQLGLANNNNNANSLQYTIDSCTSYDALSAIENNNDLYINILLKISMLQAKMNETMNDLLSSSRENNSILLLPDQISVLRAMSLNMYKTILKETSVRLHAIADSKDSRIKNMTEMSLHYTMLQLHIYELGNAGHVDDYRQVVKDTVDCCGKIALVFDDSSARKMPIHFQFPLEMALLVLIRVYKLPLLTTQLEYLHVKLVFTTIFQHFKSADTCQWHSHHQRLFAILQRFDAVDNTFIARTQSSFCLLSTMQSHLAGSICYEIIWLIFQYETRQSKCCGEPVDWKSHSCSPSKELVEYIETNNSIFL